MKHKLRTLFKTKHLKLNQRGASLIIMVFILTLVILAYMVKSLNVNELRAKEATATLQALAAAKAALLNWSVNHSSVPGLMPYPDRNGDSNYDGQSDCPGGTTSLNHLIGRLPWKMADYKSCNTLLNGLAKEFVDGTGEPLWYAVSKNLVHIYSPSGDPVINPSIIDSPTYSWLKVYDKNGNLVSDKVAVIIFAPGAPLPDQNRSSGYANVTEYLDKFTYKSALNSNQDYDGYDEDFYMGEDLHAVRSDNTDYTQPYYFNDKLTYITIDELMAELEKRAATEARNTLQKYYTANNNIFPHAAPLANNNVCEPNTFAGLLPLPSCTCTIGAASNYARTCTCSFAAVSSVAYTFVANAAGGIASYSGVANTNGSCTVSNDTYTCTCTGTGWCTRGNISIFSCSASGICNFAKDFPGKFTFTPAAGYYLTNQTGGCSSSGSNMICDQPYGGSAGTFTASKYNTCTESVLPTIAASSTAAYALPLWFTNNSWQDYIYYAVSKDCTLGVNNCAAGTNKLTAGSRSAVQALLISPGKPIISAPFAASKSSAQSSRPAANVNDYLDSTENTNGDTTFDKINNPRGSSYNDQMFIVAP